MRYITGTMKYAGRSNCNSFIHKYGIVCPTSYSNLAIYVTTALNVRSPNYAIIS